MSDIKLVSPLLDGFAIGDPISCHDGVCCYPAMKENSDEKYIVKVISVPASQKQLDALLLTGAYKDAAGALEYFKELTDGIVVEAETLQKLSKLEGFLPYDGWQVEPMYDGKLGYQIYLVSSYKRSLEKFLRRNPMTHLGAVNLGLDLCAALAICRRAGYMFVDLKPSNIYLTGEREYRIGDLGFASLKSLKYSNLPSKYRSPYTAPELHDALATLNPTADVYSLGMILYQLYNNNQLPFQNRAPREELPMPLNADYEMAEIIMKAVAPDPRHRWQSPIEMGKALVGYMQRNTVNDTPIVPPIVEQPAAPYQPEPQEEEEDLLADNPAAAAVPAYDPTPVEEDVSQLPEETEEEADEASFSNEEYEEAPEESAADELAFLEDMVSDETAPDADDSDDLSDAVMSDEVSFMLSQADDLLSFEIPEINVAEDADPEEEEIQIPQEPEDEIENILSDEAYFLPDDGEPEAEELQLVAPIEEVDAEDIVIPEENREEPAEPETEPALIIPEESISEPEAEIPAVQEVEPNHRRKSARSWIAAILILVFLALLAGGGFYFYTNYYLLTIDNMSISGYEDTLTVDLTSSANLEQLTAVCTDTYGNTFTSPIVDGQAVFTGVTPATTYKITLQAEGFHALSGSYTGSYTTKEETNIVSFTAMTGNEDGTVVLNFTVDGRETQDWMVEYSTAGEDTKSVSFTGHMVTISGLTVGQTYTFSLVAPPASDLYITGNDTLEFTASSIIVAEGLSIVSCEEGILTAQWNTPEEAVENWTVRCYSDDGYDETVTVTETTVQFSDISTDKAYTVEVTAAGMAQSARAYVTANPTTLSDVKISETKDNGLKITWSHTGEAPEGGWLLIYSIDGSEAQEVVSCDSASATVELSIPNSTYSFTIKAADGSTVFGSQAEYTTGEAKKFNAHSLSADEIQASLCKRPALETWTYEDLDSDNDYTTTFASGDKASFVLYSTKRLGTSKAETSVMYVFRDSNGKVMGELVNVEYFSWVSMWNDRYCYLNIPELPANAGEYTIEVYFDGDLVVTKKLNITG